MLKTPLSLTIGLKHMVMKPLFCYFAVFSLTLLSHNKLSYTTRTENLIGKSEIFTKIIITFDSDGVRRSSWAPECVEFYRESISGTSRVIPWDLKLLILKKYDFCPPPKVCCYSRVVAGALTAVLSIF